MEFVRYICNILKYCKKRKYINKMDMCISLIQMILIAIATP